MATDYYSLLGVERSATADDIKRAYRKRARELHPDLNPDDPSAEEQFRQVTAAYEVLSDDERRTVYDKYGEDGLKQQQWRPQYANFTDISDIFRTFFGDDLFAGMAGAGGRGSGPGRGENVLANATITLAEAALGTTREFEFTAPATCEQCDGRGAESADDLERCSTCEGQGVVRAVANSLFGQIVQQRACPTCGGEGQVIKKACGACDGVGTVAKERTVEVRIPAGIEDGQRIRVSGRGAAAPRGGENGHLYVDIIIESSEQFVRDGDDLITVVDLTITEATLGATRSVTMVDGEARDVKFAPGTQPGDIIPLRGEGMGSIRGGSRGTLRIVANVIVPTSLTAEQKEALEQFAQTESDDMYTDTGEGVVARLRRFMHL